ncbi:FkbM family methyltransferase [Humisphaera borealis]|uniref:FkbM family methyltransferase n=1 Tax=Humisphaera borealis TaxID=2807512 RepID=A0A7M2X0K2_9BACT|nr:FkbM family methyltransferase [Humisphaera borealis]QOV90631.1 FkbM family methyltransferase [Humisphaera borealis]
MFKRVARAVVPGPLRRFLQKRKLDRQVAAYPRRVVQHRYGDAILKVELADGLADGWYDHDWEPLPELAVLGRGRLGAKARVFDVGAHQGVVGLMLGRRVGSSGQVIIVEPNPHNFAMCRRNVELNAMPWVVPLQAAVSDRVGVLAFSGGLNGAAAEVSDYGGVIDVPAVTLDTLTAEYGAPDVVFVDVEGYECRALAAAFATFAAAPDWFVEVHVGCGLEAAGGSVEEVLGRFPESEFKRFVHSEGDKEAIPLGSAPAEKFSARFFLTALHRTAGV